MTRRVHKTGASIRAVLGEVELRSIVHFKYHGGRHDLTPIPLAAFPPCPANAIAEVKEAGYSRICEIRAICG